MPFTPCTQTAADFPVLSRLLGANAQWSEDVSVHEPGFFARSAQGQAPKVLWLGCADSRVPESVLTASRPGEIFVHRNIANQYPADDTNVLAVVTYAVHALGVEHVVIVGHSACGGAAACQAAAAASSLPVPAFPESSPLNTWLKPMTALAASLGADCTLDTLVDENVKKQVETAAASEPIVSAWDAGKDVWIHGWVYDLATGRLRDLACSRSSQLSK